MTEDTAVSRDFPQGLLKWSGHSGGGVKRPFHSGSGRPSGEHIETPVIHRLRTWVDELLRSPNTAPTAVLLIGGPGNGKTDAVEELVKYLDSQLHADGRVVAECVRAYTGADGALAPRLASLNLSELLESVPAGVPRQLRIVQDASEDPKQAGLSRGGLLADELLRCLRSPEQSIYVCGANRGVVSEALSAAKSEPALNAAVPILEQLLEAVTSGPKDVSCWPLPVAPRIAVWPMDVESLTATAGETQAVFRNFIRVAVDESRWPAACPAGSRCPFCTNRRVLATNEASSALCSLLRYFEIASGKRWTFRDLFSLIPHIIVGEDREGAAKSAPPHPCAWAAEQCKKSAQAGPEAMKLKLNLVSRLYQHRLFPLWPAFRSEQYQRAMRELHQVKAPELAPAIGLISWLGARRNPLETDVSKLLATTWSELLDPALASGSAVLVKMQKRACSIQDVEERFSLSVKDGLDLVRHILSDLERDVLRSLAESDDFLTSPAFPRKFANSARTIQQVVRQFASRLVKRSIGVQGGVCKGLERLREYEHASTSGGDLREFRKSLQSLLHDDRGRFTASLATTFGQPVPYRSRDVRLITSKVPVKAVQRGRSNSRPADPVPYVRIGNYCVPVTMELFGSLAERDRGLRAASLAPAVFALFDTTRSIVTGETSRDPRMLEDAVSIELGGSSQCFRIEDGRVTVVSEGDTHAT
jgi:hypothetical protein